VESSGGTKARGAVYERQTNRWEGRPAEESELIERAMRGDVMAYEDLVRRYQDPALRTASLLAGDPNDAEEAVQDAFVKAYGALERFRPGAAFRPWLLRIVANEARNRRRSAGRRAGLALRLAEDRRADDAAPSPEAAVLIRERRSTLLGAIARLRDDDRLIVGYRYLLDLSEAEAAQALGIPIGTAKSRLSRALVRLREVLGDREPLAREDPGGRVG
jgi:RNA polymerase sigma factor (sigma-70 family)